MSHISPLATSIVQATQVQQTQAAEKARQARQMDAARKSASRDDDTLELEIEDSDTIHAIDDREQPQEQKKRKTDDPDDKPPRLDLTA